MKKLPNIREEIPLVLSYSLKMKLSAILFFFILIQANANLTYGQKDKISLQLEQVSLDKVLTSIENQTDYRFIYKDDEINYSHLVSVHADKLPLRKVLPRLFKGMQIDFYIMDNQIVLKPRKPAVHKGSLLKQVQVNNMQQSVKGTVVDEQGQPLPGASIIEKGTSNGVVTDFDGNYSITVSGPASILVFSYVGFETREMTVGTQTTMEVSLLASSQGLEEVVVVGYGSVSKSDLTGAVSTVDSETINAFPTTDVQQALKGRSAGVRVVQNSGQPGSGVQVQVRGGNSYLGNNNPLYVVDGFPITGGIDFLNPTDIESINILKDASATAIYGSRGANGVVMITTKGGSKGRRGNINVQSYYGIQTVIDTYELLNNREFAQVANAAAANEGISAPFDLNNLPTVETDWQDIIFREAAIQSHTITFSGGSESSSYSASANYFENEGIIIGTGQKRGSARLTLDQKVNDWARINANTVVTRLQIDDANVNNGNSGSNIWSAALQAPPMVPPYDEAGGYSPVDSYPFSPVSINNPLLYNEVKNQVLSSKMLANMALELSFNENLKLKIQGGTEQEFRERNYYSPSILVKTSPQGNAATDITRDVSYLNENILSYDKNIGEDDKLSAIAGFTYQTFKRRYNRSSATGFPNDILENNALGGAENTNPNESSVTDWKLLSWLGRINYNLDNKYLFTASIRADGSSRFGENNKWGVFSSGAFAWRLSNENFLKDWESLSDMKLRIGYGQTGSTAINSYQSLNTLGQVRATFGKSDAIGYASVSAPNPNLKWETTTQLGIGLDMAFLNNKYRFTVDYYKKNTKNLLAIIPLPGSTGFTSQITNLGEIQNTGMEFSLGAIFGKNDFTWDVSGQLSYNRNEVITIGQDILGAPLDIPFSSSVNIAREGEPLGMFYGFLEDGYDDQGVIKYKDLNEDGVINNDDQTILGNPYPDFVFGLNSTLAYKDVSLNIFLEGSQGNELFWATGGYIANSFSTGGNQLVDVYKDYWTPDNTDAAYPAPSENRSQLRTSDRFVEDASYIRLKNVKLAYDLPVDKLDVGISALQLYISGQNLFTISDFPGLDPDVNTRASTGDLRIGIAQTPYPNAKTFTLGLNIKL
ncbi:TonB-dependent receptor [Galbibacter pacificus]|uniref:TonB-dependent receptor n=1 Tax=Galbibacter pacificus TaxID=2996052 RepID=A0ABT6FN98_9FLAO|nr:TonB-dependent receptor [Galbibacter pacificus]MDG3581169.1 TonB-dependent receptor [Galbibacter pacificus]MDG3584647.1 TonB-dependent receptor [Galbibacter pacificus]